MPAKYVPTADQRAITTVGDGKAVSDLLALLIDFDAGFPVVEPGR